MPVSALTPNGHATVPPALTEASLVKKLEELGIGRPSTWASIIQTVQDRGYVWKKGQALVPTWTAFAVVGLLEKHFDDLVDYAFTARVEEDLDSIARNERGKVDWLQDFYFGAMHEERFRPQAARRREPRPHRRCRDQHVPDRPRPRRQRDRGEARQVRPLREGRTTPPACPTTSPRRAHRRQGARAARCRRATSRSASSKGFRCSRKNGRYGPYVQWGTPDNLPPGLEKPKMASLFKTMTLERSASTQPTC